MEEEREEEEEYIQSLSKSTDMPSENRSEDCDESQKVTAEQEPEQAESGATEEESEPSQQTQISRRPQEGDDCPPTKDDRTPPSVSSHPSSTQSRPAEPCWYCLRSLDSDYRPQAPKQKDSDPESTLPSSGQMMSYQTDPRPHFGVASSSRSTCRPLWGSEGPCWGHRNQEVSDQTHVCPHCHLELPTDTLRWHEAKCLLFEGLRNFEK